MGSGGRISLMSRTWLSIRVDLIGGGGEELWPRPGRIFAAARRHTFEQLATAIDDAFARWDRHHLHEFQLDNDLRVAEPDLDFDEPGTVLDTRKTKLSQLIPGQQFVYIFDLGDCWTYLCTVGDERIDPLEAVGIEPSLPCPYWGWGTIPDQYGRCWDEDDSETPLPPDPQLADLPALYPGWGVLER
ncbi:plasmid pRiA4b ORF-3 family protein [Nocardia arthritidis]|uniref:Plasmid pRiA4b Orf3-like domain-containing protein n=1 Tax=Nocardia arthritidis TaxID=228602 RepID=A0A6G9Y9A0_9NOCA|nr:plasmid pRiA4b ORF-3 family protein [Nocardia arthritidis]QIS09791.1 hypothetical protein F5544_09455 [Nocardia arthritidis]